MRQQLLKIFSPTPLKVLVLLYIAFYIFILSKVYINRFSAFGCFDECFNYVSGYFILSGKRLYSEIFFNHQLLMAYLSVMIQLVFKPEGIYSLILQHRMFVVVFSLILSLILIMRFRFKALGFVLVFELTKFYFMGSLFLAESILVYPLVYLFGLTLQRFEKKNISLIDYLLAGLFAWFVLFLREPMTIVVLILYSSLFYRIKFHKKQVISLSIFFLLTAITILFTSLPHFFLEVIYINYMTLFTNEIGSNGSAYMWLLKVFFYPLLIFTYNKQSFLLPILLMINIMFLFAAFILIKQKKVIYVLWIWIILGLSNLRFVIPGVMYYEAFHQLPWYGLFIFATTSVIEKITSLSKQKFNVRLFIFAFVCIVVYALLFPHSFIHERVDKNREFTLNFDKYYIYGQAIRYLSKEDSTLFVEQWDDLIYWQAKVKPAYKYSLYEGPAHVNNVFVDERVHMFQTSPPDFYYNPCNKNGYFFTTIPQFAQNLYKELTYVNGRGCLFVKKTIYDTISEKQWNQLGVLRFGKSQEDK